MVKIVISMLAASSVACAVFSAPSQSQSHSPMSQVATPDGRKSLVVAGGCFWCLEVLFEELKGVQFVESCYVGGSRAGVTYQEVCSGTTGHAEAIRVSSRGQLGLRTSPPLQGPPPCTFSGGIH